MGGDTKTTIKRDGAQSKIFILMKISQGRKTVVFDIVVPCFAASTPHDARICASCSVLTAVLSFDCSLSISQWKNAHQTAPSPESISASLADVLRDADGWF
jgi:hypothetical protein